MLCFFSLKEIQMMILAGRLLTWGDDAVGVADEFRVSGLCAEKLPFLE